MLKKLIIRNTGMEQYGVLENDEIIYDREIMAMRGELAVATFEQSKYYGIYDGADEDGCENFCFLNGNQIRLDPRDGYTRIGRVIAVFRWNLGRSVDVKDEIVARARFLKVAPSAASDTPSIPDNELGVFSRDGRIWVSSRDVAEKFEKPHDKVLRSIRTLDCSPEFTAANFGVSEYKDPTGRTLPQYLMTRDGFTFLAMGFTGTKAARFKEAYIAEFNRMEEELYRRRFSLPDSVPKERERELMTAIQKESKKAVTAMTTASLARKRELALQRRLDAALDLIAELKEKDKG